MTLWRRKPNVEASMPVRLTDGDRVNIKQLPTGMHGLDQVLGGGLPQYSFNLIAGAPGTGKTTLSQELMFALATPEWPALHITVLVEPALNAPRFEQQFSFSDSCGVGTSFHYVNLTHATLEQGLSTVLDTIVDEVDRVSPGIVVVDSFLTVMRAASAAGHDTMELQEFLDRLALHLASRQITTLLVGEFGESEVQRNPVMTVADGVVWLYASIDRNADLRQLQVVKMRGQAPLPGLHTLRITGDKLEVLPRMVSRAAVLDR